MTGHCPSHERCTTVSTTEQLGNRDNERYRKNKVDSGWRMHTFPNSPKRKKLQNTKNLRDRIYSHRLKISMKINNQTIQSSDKKHKTNMKKIDQINSKHDNMNQINCHRQNPTLK